MYTAIVVIKMSFKSNIKVNSPNVAFDDANEYLEVNYEYAKTNVRRVGDVFNVSVFHVGVFEVRVSCDRMIVYAPHIFFFF